VDGLDQLACSRSMGNIQTVVPRAGLNRQNATRFQNSGSQYHGSINEQPCGSSPTCTQQGHSDGGGDAFYPLGAAAAAAAFVAIHAPDSGAFHGGFHGGGCDDGGYHGGDEGGCFDGGDCAGAVGDGGGCGDAGF